MSKNIYTIIADCVTSLKKVCAITSVSSSGTTYTFYTKNLNGIDVGLYVNFGTIRNYIVTAISTNNYFQVVSSEDLSAYTSASIACNFKKGSDTEICDIISEENMSNDKRFQIYPLIALIRGGINISEPNNEVINNLSIWIFVPAIKTDRTDARVTNNLEKTLEPYFRLFRNELKSNKYIIETPNTLFDKIKQSNEFDIQKLTNNCDSIQLKINNLNIKADL
jgi:hypothetical protein